MIIYSTDIILFPNIRCTCIKFVCAIINEYCIGRENTKLVRLLFGNALANSIWAHGNIYTWALGLHMPLPKKTRLVYFYFDVNTNTISIIYILYENYVYIYTRHKYILSILVNRRV